MLITDLTGKNIDKPPKYLITHNAHTATVSFYGDTKLFLDGKEMPMKQAEDLLKVLSKALEIGHTLQRGIAI